MAFENYGDNLRDLYDNIIVSVNAEPDIVRAKHGVSRINNIFDEYAGIAPDKRAYDAPEGIKVFKHIGFTTQNGGYASLPMLTPSVKTPPPTSPIRTVSFPPMDPNTNNPKGYTSPTSPGGRENTTWPRSQSFLDRALEERRTNTSCKIPIQQQGTRDFRVGDGSVLNPTQDRSTSKSYREVTTGQGPDLNRRLPNVALPGQSEQPSASGFKVDTGAPDIKLNTNRDITPDESSAWIPRIEQASKSVTNFLRHGIPERKYNIHSPDGYIKVSMLVQLPQFRQWKIDARILEVILMHGRQRLMLNADKT